MKRAILVFVLVFSVFFGAQIYGQNSSPIDLVLLLDTSSNMSSSYENVNNYITGAFLNEFLRVGDTFHLISFSGNPRLDAARRISGVGDIETIIGRMFLQYPVEKGANVGAAITYAEQYIISLPNRPKKIVLVTAGGSDTNNLVSSAKSRLSSKNTTLDYIQVTPGQPLTNLPKSGRLAVVKSTTSTAASSSSSTASSASSSATSSTTKSSTSVSGTETTKVQGSGTSTDNTSTRKTEDTQSSAGTSTTSTSTASNTGSGTSSDSGKTSTNTSTTASTSTDTKQDSSSKKTTESSGSSSASETSKKTSSSERAAGASGSWATSLPLIIGVILLILLLLGLIIFFASRKLGSKPNRAMTQAASSRSSTSSAASSSKASTASSSSAASKSQERFADHSKDLAGYASASGSARRSPYEDRNQKAPVINPSGPLLLNLHVEDQSTSIGKRNIHSLKSGFSFTVGGGKSDDFLIFLVPIPAAIGEIRRDGATLTFTPRKPKYFPDIGANPVKDCINKTIRIVSDKNYEMHFRFEMYEDPLIALNRVLTQVKVPGM